MADVNSLLAKARTDMDQVIESFKTEIQKLRAGAVNVEHIKNIHIDVYGSKVPMYQVATITAQSAIAVTITPWDKNNLRSISEGINEEFKGEVNPNVRDNAVYLNFPPVTQEKKEEYVKMLKEKAEQFRQRLRDVRQDVKSDIEELKKNSEAPEDVIFKGLEDLDNITKQYTENINDIFENKKEQLLK